MGSDETIGGTIKRRRHQLGLGVREFARQLQISPSYLVDIEADRRLPAKRLTERIAIAVNRPSLLQLVRAAVRRRWENGKR
jgi:transcriptional regulator with XRE-family HTH domain